MRAQELAFEADTHRRFGRAGGGLILAPYAVADPATRRGQVSPLCLILHELATNGVNYAIGRLDP